MEQFFQRMHVRKESLKKQKLSKKDQWKADESEVRHGSCDFPVKYLGYTEVHESKGAEICRQSFYRLKHDESSCKFGQLFKRNKRRKASVSTPMQQHATFQISSEGVRIMDENADVLVDTPIASISYCCPNSQHERGFTYICRGDVPWKWNCHAMEAAEDLGERLNHAVGCSFTVCLEKRVMNKRLNIVATSAVPIQDVDGTGYTYGDFRKLPIADRHLDPQASLVVDLVPKKSSDPTVYVSVNRPRGPAELKERKGSFGAIMEAHPYKRYREENVDDEEVELRNSSD